MIYINKNSLIHSTGFHFSILFFMIFINTTCLNAHAKLNNTESKNSFSKQSILHPSGSFQDSLMKKAIDAIERGAEYFHSLNIHGGYVYNYLLDKSRKWGETEYFDATIEVQPPGTPAVGVSFIIAYKATGNIKFLTYAEKAAKALLYGQNKHGGWDHTITFGKGKISVDVSFDDNQTQSAIRFLMMIDQYSDDPEIESGVINALRLMLKSQQEKGAWPHYYPAQGNYHDYATFNDGGINSCIEVMMDAYKYYKKNEYLHSIEKAGRYIYISQLPPPQPGWAQQYNEFLQPVWARTFEPPSVCPLVTIRNINSLLDIFLLTKDDFYLEPIPDAIRWMKESRLPNGKWARFIEIGTNNALYYDRGRIRVNSLEELSVERRLTYGYQQDLVSAFDSTENRYMQIKNLGSKKYKEKITEYLSSDQYMNELKNDVVNIIAEQDSQGRWITYNDKFKNKVPGKMWKGDFINADRISSARFNYYVSRLSEFISTCKINRD